MSEIEEFMPNCNPCSMQLLRDSEGLEGNFTTYIVTCVTIKDFIIIIIGFKLFFITVCT